jgi:two-component system OmpR family response regulator
VAKILIAHADGVIREFLRRTLETDGHWVLALSGPHQLPLRLASHRPDLLLVQNGRDEDLRSLADQARHPPVGTAIPVAIIVAGENEWPSTERLSEFGIQAVLDVASLATSKVLAAVHAALHRNLGPRARRKILKFGDLELNRDTRSVRLGASVARGLAERHFNILWFLVQRAIETRDVCPRQLLLARIWKTRVRDREVDVTISRLKSRAPFLSAHIETVPGRGYRFLLP